MKKIFKCFIVLNLLFFDKLIIFIIKCEKMCNLGRFIRNFFFIRKLYV